LKIDTKVLAAPFWVSASFVKKTYTTARYRFTLILFLLFCLLSYYSFGTAAMDYFMLYPSRFLVGESEFVAYHKFLELTIMPISVYPFLLIIVLNVVMLWFRPGQVSKVLVGCSLAVLVADLISTALLQAPWNFELGKGKNIALMQKITDTNWIRVILETSQVVIVFLMLKQMVFKLSMRSTS
jgi:hypothetical protein